MFRQPLPLWPLRIRRQHFREPDAVRRVAMSRELLAVSLNHPGHYVHWGVIQISVANLVVIGLMIALFALAIFLPFPQGRREP